MLGFVLFPVHTQAAKTVADQATKKQMVMDQLKGQVQLANAQALLEVRESFDGCSRITHILTLFCP